VNYGTPEVEAPTATEVQVEAPSPQPASPVRPAEASRVGDVTEARETGESRARDEFGTEAFRFDDPYWDDAFDSYHNPTLRVCCKR
jgi:hypothetical protein